MKIAYLEVTSYEGLHFYGTLRYNSLKLELSHRLTASETIAMNKQRDGWYWRPGMNYSGFASKAAVIEAARQALPKFCPDAAIVILGRNVYRHPQPILIGPPELIVKSAQMAAEVGRLYGNRSEPSDWQRYEELSNEWAAMLLAYEKEN